MPNCPWCQIVRGAKLSTVPNCPRCQIVRGAKLSILHCGAKLSVVPNCPRCQIVRGAKLSGAKLSAVPNCPRCQIVLVPNCPIILFVALKFVRQKVCKFKDALQNKLATIFSANWTISIYFYPLWRFRDADTVEIWKCDWPIDILVGVGAKHAYAFKKRKSTFERIWYWRGHIRHKRWCYPHCLTSWSDPGLLKMLQSQDV